MYPIEICILLWLIYTKAIVQTLVQFLCIEICIIRNFSFRRYLPSFEYIESIQQVGTLLQIEIFIVITVAASA